MLDRDAGRVCVTGYGMVSALGSMRNGSDGGGIALATLDAPDLDADRFAPLVVFREPGLDTERWVPRKADRRMMGPTMTGGVIAAGLALEGAQLEGRALDRDALPLIVAATCGERDIAVADRAIEATLELGPDSSEPAHLLHRGLRPSLFLAQLPNMAAANVAMVHGVRGASVTYMAEELGGIGAVVEAAERVAAGEAGACLVGGIFHPHRPDVLIAFAGGLARGAWASAREARGGCLGAVSAFLLLESAEHARSRGATVLAELAAPTTRFDAPERAWSALDASAFGGASTVLSGASGATASSVPELARLRDALADAAIERFACTADLVGHAIDAGFIAGLTLATRCLERGDAPPAYATEGAPAAAPGATHAIAVTASGAERGLAVALVEPPS